MSELLEHKTYLITFQTVDNPSKTSLCIQDLNWKEQIWYWREKNELNY